MKYTIYSPDRAPITEVELGDEVDRAREHDTIAITAIRLIKRVRLYDTGNYLFNSIYFMKETMPDNSIGLIVLGEHEGFLRQILAQ